MKILFVCTGNTCRSPLAEGLLKALLKNRKKTGSSQDDIDVFSAGTSAYFQTGATDDAIEVARKYGADLSLHRSRLLDKEMIKDADLVLTMEIKHREFARRLAVEDAKKIFLLNEYASNGNTELKDEWGLEIADPIGHGTSAYERCAEEIFEALKKVIRRLDEMNA